MALGTFNNPAVAWGQRNKSFEVIALTASTDLDINQQLVLLDTSGCSGDVTLTLPPAHNVPAGTVVAIKLSDATHGVTPASNNADLEAISGTKLTATGGYAVIMACGFMWVILSTSAT